MLSSHTLTRLLRSAVTALVPATALACSDLFSPGREVVLRLADLQVPSVVVSSGPLDGTAVVQLGGCLSFRRLVISRAGSIVHVTAQGHDAGGPNVGCTADIRYVSYAVRIAGPFLGQLTIQGHQPDGSILARTVAVQ
jgi:hypothetical protein